MEVQSMDDQVNPITFHLLLVSLHIFGRFWLVVHDDGFNSCSKLVLTLGDEAQTDSNPTIEQDLGENGISGFIRVYST